MSGPPQKPNEDDPRLVPIEHEREVLVRSIAKKMFRVTDPVRIGRFVVVERAGSGGMGVVYRAYDPSLEREVALKLLRPLSDDRGPSDHKRSRALERLMREARAIAKVTHENVVTVHEVGLLGDELFVAMEFVDGPTLREWMEQHSPSWPEVLALHIQAGRGLAAAHAAGIVHRDYKPDNVLIGRGGRPRVADFGLARLNRAADEQPHASEFTQAIAMEATQTGVRLGTVRYMAPEQLAGEVATPASDQFSFCVSLWESLAGTRPFQGASLEEYREVVNRGQPSNTDALRALPIPLQRALLRGLSVDPALRHPSMDALLDALASSASRRTRRWGLAAGALTLAVVGGAVVAGQQADADPEMCGASNSRMAETWTEQRRQSVAAGLASERPQSAGIVSSSLELLDAYASEWTDDYQDACRATRVRGDQSETMFDRRMTCMSRAATAFDALTQQLTEADAELSDNSISAISELPRLELCRDTERLSVIALPETPEQADAVAEIDARVARAEGAMLAGDFEPAAEQLMLAVEDARAVGFAPTTARALLVLGELETTLGREGADERLEQSFTMAVRGGDHRQAAGAALALQGAAVGVEGRGEDARRWSEIAAAHISRLADAGDLEARRVESLAALAYEERDFKASSSLYEQALELAATAQLGPVFRGELAVRAARTQIQMGQFDRAQANLETAADVFSEVYGPAHPKNASALAAIGAVHSRRGEYEEAFAAFSKALDIVEPALGEHPTTAAAHANLSSAAASLRKFDLAETHARAALDMVEKTEGSESPKAAMVLTNLANLAQQRGQPDVALEYLDRSVAHPKHPRRDHVFVARGQLKRSTGDFEGAIADYRAAQDLREQSGVPDLAIRCMLLVGDAQLAAGEDDEALATHRQALDALDAAGLDEHIHRADALSGLGRAQASRGRHKDAIVSFELALQRYGDLPSVRWAEAAKAEFGLGQSLWARGRNDDAIEHVENSLETARKAESANPELLEAIESWLAER